MKKTLVSAVFSSLLVVPFSTIFAQSLPQQLGAPSIETAPMQQMPSFQAPPPQTDFQATMSRGPFAPFAFAQNKGSEQAYELAQQYGRCASNVSPARVRAVLEAAPNTWTEFVRMRTLSSNARPCLSYGYSPGTIFLRGSLAEAMYRRTAVDTVLHSHGTTAQQIDSFLNDESLRSRMRLKDDRDFVNVSNCLVIRAPGAVRAVLLSAHGSQAERRDLEALITSAPGCSEPARLPVTASASFLRAYLAESALRWSAYAALVG